MTQNNYIKFLNELKTCSLITLPIAIIFYFSFKQVFVCIAIYVVLTLIVALWSFLADNTGYKRHCNIVDSEAFRKLIQNGFSIERENDYVGINGIYKNYLFDIYYDWLTVSNNKNSRAIVLNVYFDPPKFVNGETNHELLEEISKRNITSTWSLKPYNFRWREGNLMMNNTVGLKNPNYEFIVKRMDLLIDILKRENLQFVEKSIVLEKRKVIKHALVPEILVYFNKNSY